MMDIRRWSLSFLAIAVAVSSGTAGAAEIGPVTLVCRGGDPCAGVARHSLAAFERAATDAMNFTCRVRLDAAGRAVCTGEGGATATGPSFREILALARPGRWIFAEVEGSDGEMERLADAMRDDLMAQKTASPRTLILVVVPRQAAVFRRALPDYRLLLAADGLDADVLAACVRESGACGVLLTDRPDAFTRHRLQALAADGCDVHLRTAADLAAVRDAFRRGARTVMPESRAREILEEAFPVPPNVLWIEAGLQLWNVRDIGWTGLRRGRAFRGSAWESPDGRADEPSLAAYVKTMGIRTDIDLRGEKERVAPTNVRVAEHGVRDVWCPVAAYLGLWDTSADYAKAMRVFADPSSYPVYFHCAGGADRTGTLAFLVEALCGVDERTICRDFEATNRFGGRYGYRSANAAGSTAFWPMLERFKGEFRGDTLQAKAEDCCRRLLGLSAEEVGAIRRELKTNGRICCR